jgi:hypothetical protein
MNDELWGLAAGLFGNQDPGNEVYDYAGAQGEKRERGPDEADDRRVGIEMDANPGADSCKYPSILRAKDLFHTGRKGVLGY